MPNDFTEKDRWEMVFRLVGLVGFVGLSVFLSYCFIKMGIDKEPGEPADAARLGVFILDVFCVFGAFSLAAGYNAFQLILDWLS